MTTPRLTSPDLAWRGALMSRTDLASSPTPKVGEVEVDSASKNRSVEEEMLRRGRWTAASVPRSLLLQRPAGAPEKET